MEFAKEKSEHTFSDFKLYSVRMIEMSNVVLCLFFFKLTELVVVQFQEVGKGPWVTEWGGWPDRRGDVKVVLDVSLSQNQSEIESG